MVCVYKPVFRVPIAPFCMRFFLLVLVCICIHCTYAQTPHTDSLKTIQLNEIVVKGNPLAIGQSQDGGIDVNMKRLDKLPQVMGTPDPVRLLQMYPGVAVGGDVNTGLFVRGGDPSQNLMLLNGAPLINVMHFTGLFSAFIPDHLSGFTLYKSYIPPAYGGRVGALLNVETKEDIPKRFEANIDIGFLASNMTLAIPLSSRWAFYVSGRASYLSLYNRKGGEYFTPFFCQIDKIR